MKKAMATIIVTLFLASITAFNVGSVQAVTIDIAPDTLNVYNTNGNYISAHIEPSIFFSDNFETETVGLEASKWTAVSGEWRVEYDEGNVYSVDRTLSPNVEAITVAGDVSWTDYILEYKVKITEDGIEREGSAFVRADADAQNGYLIHPQAGTGTYQGYVALWKRVGGSYTLITRAWGDIQTDVWHSIKVAASGPNIKVYVDGSTVPTIDYTDTISPFLDGRIGLRLADNRHAHFDDVIVTENFDVTTIDVGTVKLWHMFSDDFEGGVADGWTKFAGDWEVTNREYSGDAGTNISISVINGISTTNMTIQTDFNAKTTRQYQNALIVFDVQSDIDWKYAGALVIADKWVIGIGHWDGSWQHIEMTGEAIEPNTWYQIKVVIDGTKVMLYADGVEKVTYDFSSIGTGGIGLGGIKSLTHFDNVLVLSPIADALLEPTLISDYDNDMAPDLEVKFDRAVVTEYLRTNEITSGEVELVITGKANGADFAGSDSVRVIARGKLKVPKS